MEFLLKIIVVGDGFTGKTSIIKRYAQGTFSDNYKVTVIILLLSKSFSLILI